jgi:prolipoprotein diacylglyceryl transferase
MRHVLSFIPSPPSNGIHIGSLFIHYYGLMYVIGITLAVIITRRRWAAMGGNPDLVGDVAIWAVPAGLIGARIYFDITTPNDIPPHWWGAFAIWSGGLGIWGGIAAGAAAGIWRVRRAGASGGQFANAIAPALLVAQAVGRVGNYFNQELFGRPTTLPWGLEISAAHRPAQYASFATFQPTFLYEIIWDLALAAFLVWLGHHRRIRPWGLFALYVAGYSAFRIFEESVRIDSSEHFLGLRLNFYVASVLTLAGLAWFARAQRGPETLAGPGSGTDGPGPDAMVTAGPDGAGEPAEDRPPEPGGRSGPGGATAVGTPEALGGLPDGQPEDPAADTAAAGRRSDQ